MEAVKPGNTTSEWKGKIVTQVVTVICMFAPRFLNIEITDEAQLSLIELGMSLVGGVEAAYAVSRGIAKRK